MMSLAMQWATTRGGLVAWVLIVLVIVGVGLLMRHLSLAGRLLRGATLRRLSDRLTFPWWEGSNWRP